MKLILRIFINAVAIWVTSLVLPGLVFDVTLISLVLVGILFGLVNALIRPIVKLLTLPINVITLGLFTLVINAAMLVLTVLLADALTLQGGLGDKLIAIFVGAILISIVSTVLSWVLPD